MKIKKISFKKYYAYDYDNNCLVNIYDSLDDIVNHLTAIYSKYVKININKQSICGKAAIKKPGYKNLYGFYWYNANSILERSNQIDEINAFKDLDDYTKIMLEQNVVDKYLKKDLIILRNNNMELVEVFINIYKALESIGIRINSGKKLLQKRTMAAFLPKRNNCVWITGRDIENQYTLDELFDNIKSTTIKYNLTEENFRQL